MAKIQRTIPAELEGARLDKALVALVEGASRARVKRAIEARAVRVNGRSVPKGAVVAAGDLVEVEEAQLAGGDTACVPEPSARLTELHVSPKLLVVDKPAGQPTAPLRDEETGTLANALVGHYPELSAIGYSPREPGIVHRLDTETSGAVVAARTLQAFEALREALQAERIVKEYLLVCVGDALPDRGSVEFPIANHPKDKRRVYPCVHPRDVMRYAPRPAVTSFAVERRVGGRALVRVHAARAVRHQIRAHFAALGHPLLGDVLYGGEPVHGLSRHALHAARVAFDGGGDPDLAFDVTAALPADLEALLAESAELPASPT